ncbi:hypothetical protein [Chryseobacterium sp. CFBP8996]|uniref:hypothetical protein n=1 Tax=Chryseobacterium sp. CFBP8996 TaxID=3096529 RepID=UPI002A6AFAD4|nr:hypothetical protein [Chryseobacterium sp. CFBP8996]MDY0932509.1 hypothetical protein [Chryseobacterium sp. CFBP8996]
MNESKINIEFIIKKQNPILKEKDLIHNKNSRKNKLKLTPVEYNEILIFGNLSEFKKKIQYDGIDWQYQSSRNTLNNGLLAETVLSILNSGIIFANYSPQKNDFLKIWLEYKYPIIHNKSRPYIGDFISFIYNEEWKINNGYDHIDFEYETLQEGEIKIS